MDKKAKLEADERIDSDSLKNIVQQGDDFGDCDMNDHECAKKSVEIPTLAQDDKKEVKQVKKEDDKTSKKQQVAEEKPKVEKTEKPKESLIKEKVKKSTTEPKPEAKKE